MEKSVHVAVSPTPLQLSSNWRVVCQSAVITRLGMQLGESSAKVMWPYVAKMLQTAPQPTSGRLSNLAAGNGQRNQQLNVIPHFLGGMHHGIEIKLLDMDSSGSKQLHCGRWRKHEKTPKPIRRNTEPNVVAKKDKIAVNNQRDRWSPWLTVWPKFEVSWLDHQPISLSAIISAISPALVSFTWWVRNPLRNARCFKVWEAPRAALTPLLMLDFHRHAAGRWQD